MNIGDQDTVRTVVHKVSRAIIASLSSRFITMPTNKNKINHLKVF